MLFISQFLFIECNDMSTTRKDVIAYASIIDPALCDGVVVKLITTKSTEQVCTINNAAVRDHFRLAAC